MAALQFPVCLGFFKKFMTPHYHYLGKFQRFQFNSCKIMAQSNLRHLYGKSQQSLTSLAFVFSPENSNAYNFLSNENMTLKLHIMTHLDKIFLVIQFSLLLQTF